MNRLFNMLTRWFFNRMMREVSGCKPQAALHHGGFVEPNAPEMAPDITLKVIKALNGRAIQVCTPFDPNNAKARYIGGQGSVPGVELFLVPEGMSIAEAFTTVTAMKQLERM